jgi:cysteine-rich repeat protein
MTKRHGWILAGLLFGLAAAACGGIVATPTDGGDDDGSESIDVPPDGDGDSEDARREDTGGGDDGGEVPPGCGDGVVDDGEQCDDGNDRSGDGCETDCTWTCESNTDCLDTETCNGAEACTDHVCVDGTPLGDGHTCTTAEGAGGTCQGGLCEAAACGNTRVEPGEDCDDGNAIAGDGCETDCTWTCTVPADCDDGLLCNGVEGCNATSHTCITVATPDGTECVTAEGAEGSCSEELCVPAGCGNGIVETGEDCDDGNESNTDACLNDCRVASCGDGYVRAGVEQCDGADVACTTTCGTAGLRACVACSLADACSPPAEVCDGTDNDCDTACDNGFGCCRGATTSGTEGACPWTQTCGETCTLGARSFGPPPSNDTCSAPTLLTPTGGSITVTGSTCAARDDYTPTCVASDSAEVVYELRLTSPKFVVIDTDGSLIDTVLELRGGSTGSGCAGAGSLACNDDNPRVTTGASQIAMRLTAGTYWILLDGWMGAIGSYTMHVYLSDPPANDTCATAVPLTLAMTPASTFGTNVGATDDGDVACAGWPTAGPDVWYSVTLGAARHLLYLDLLDLPGWSGVIRIYDACGGTMVACAGGPTCGVERPQWIGALSGGIAGSTYYIAVDGETATDQGAFSLRYQMAGPGCADATILTGAGRYDDNLLGILSRTSGTCGGIGDENLYAIGLCPGGSIAANTCDTRTAFDSVLYARQNGCGLPSLGSASQVACATAPGDCAFTNGTAITFGSGLPTGLYFVFVDSDVGASLERLYALNISRL